MDAAAKRTVTDKVAVLTIRFFIRRILPQRDPRRQAYEWAECWRVRSLARNFTVAPTGSS
jgi:hypothetical protein